MKRLILITLFSLFSIFTFAEDTITLGLSSELKSSVLDEKRSFMVYLPPTYSENKNTFPVIYLLDGDVHRFKGFVGVLEALSTGTLGNQVQQAIVVAIPSTNRTRDLTPSELNEWTFKGQTLDTFSHTGQALLFQRFLKEELIPRIEAAYRTSDKRLLVGESFGGLFAANVLLTDQALFSDYLLIDPTALWDDNYLNRTYDNKSGLTPFASNTYFAFANNSHLGEIGVTNYKWGADFAESVINKSENIAKQRYFESETHGTVALLAWYEGLKSLLPTEDVENTK
jgi:predicted alpha/beta superfamily hydrolase